jgi:hypothetical protein
MSEILNLRKSAEMGIKHFSRSVDKDASVEEITILSILKAIAEKQGLQFDIVSFN